MNESAVAVRQESAVDLEAPISRALQTINKGGITIVQAEVTIPAHHQYVIPAGRKKVGNEWVDQTRVGITADGYDHINRFVGCQFLIPEFIHDSEGNQVRNPIHRKDYIYERMVAIWYNDLGQMQAYSEDLEVDYQILYQQARLNASWYEDGAHGRQRRTAELKVVRGEDGAPLTDDRGNPRFALVLPDDQELKALQRLYDLRATGLRYAQTVLKNRLMKVVTGIRMLPIDQPKPFKVRVFGYRDNMTPEQRIDQAMQDQRQIFGRALEAGGTLSDEELAAVELSDDRTEVDETLSEVKVVSPPEE